MESRVKTQTAVVTIKVLQERATQASSGKGLEEAASMGPGLQSLSKWFQRQWDWSDGRHKV